MPTILTQAGRLMWVEQVQDDDGLTDAADIAVAATLSRFHNSKTGRLNPAVATIAKAARVGLNATRKALKRLAERGHLRAVPVPGGTTQYDLVLKAGEATPHVCREATPHVCREATPHVCREPHPSRTGTGEPMNQTSEMNPAPLAPPQRNLVLRVLNRYDSLGDRPVLYEAIRSAGMTPAAWGSQAIRAQILTAHAAGTLTI